MSNYPDFAGPQGPQGPQDPWNHDTPDDPPRHWHCPHCGVFFDWQAHPLTVAQYVDNEPGIPHITCPSCQRCMGCKH